MRLAASYKDLATQRGAIEANASRIGVTRGTRAERAYLWTYGLPVHGHPEWRFDPIDLRAVYDSAGNNISPGEFKSKTHFEMPGSSIIAPIAPKPDISLSTPRTGTYIPGALHFTHGLGHKHYARLQNLSGLQGYAIKNPSIYLTGQSISIRRYGSCPPGTVWSADTNYDTICQVIAQPPPQAAPPPPPPAPVYMPSINVSPAIQTTVSPQISPVFQQSYMPSGSPMTAGTTQIAPSAQKAVSAPAPAPTPTPAPSAPLYAPPPLYGAPPVYPAPAPSYSSSPPVPYYQAPARALVPPSVQGFPAPVSSSPAVPPPLFSVKNLESQWPLILLAMAGIGGIVYLSGNHGRKGGKK